MPGIRLAALILSIFALILLGVIARWLRILREDDSARLNRLVIYLVLPAFIFRAARGAELSSALLKVPVVALTVAFVMLGLAYAAARLLGLERRTAGAFLMATPVGNTGYLGYPLTQLIFGAPHVIKAVFYDMFGTVVFLFTVGLLVAKSYGATDDKTSKLRELVTFPPLLALVVGLLLKDVTMPRFVGNAINLLAGATIPLIMISIGLALRPAKLTGMAVTIVAVLILKLGLAPLVAIGAGWLIGLHAETLRIVVLEASMPIAVLSLIIGLRYELDADFLAGSILVTTLISALTIPLWQQLVSRFA